MSAFALFCACAQSGFRQERLWFSGHDQVPCWMGDVTMGEELLLLLLRPKQRIHKNLQFCFCFPGWGAEKDLYVLAQKCSFFPIIFR